ncbi:MAG: DUF4279 domain-containing protein [Solirubrobacterales bacterium]
MESKLPKVNLYFRFYGEAFDPDEITRRLGIEPTTSFRPGDPITKDGQGTWRGYGWMVEIGPSRTLAVDSLLQEFRQRFDVSASAVKALCRDLSVNLVILCGVGVEGAETAPSLFFPSSFLEWVTELGASLNVDVEW